MAETPLRSIENEPTVMWRMQRGTRLSTHAVIGLRGHAAWVMWFLNGRPLGVRDFDDWDSALRWSDQMQVQNWSVGWRHTPDADDAPPAE